MKRFVGYLIGKTPRAKKVAPTITQPKQLKKTMKKMSGGKNTKKAKVNKDKARVKKAMGKTLQMRDQNSQIEGFQDYVKRMFGGGQS